MGAKFKYCVDGDLVIKDLPAQPDTYRDGEILKAAVAEEGAIASMGIGTGSFVGVCNQDETLPAASGYSQAGVAGGNNGATLAGTQAAGTLDTLKVIINPGAIYALEYDSANTLSWSAVTDTTVDFVDSGTTNNFGGGWAWSTDTGAFDYVVSSNTAVGTTTLTTVTGTDTASAAGILIVQAGTGLAQSVALTTDALYISGDDQDRDALTPGTNSISIVVLENRVESLTHGSEILRPKQPQNPGGLENQGKRDLTNDKAKVFAYARIVGSVWNQ